MLSELMGQLERLDQWDRKKVYALMDCLGMELEEALYRHQDYILLGSVFTDKELGRYLVAERLFEVPEKARRYFDFEKLGRDMRVHSKGGFSKWGFVY